MYMYEDNTNCFYLFKIQFYSTLYFENKYKWKIQVNAWTVQEDKDIRNIINIGN